MISGSSSEEVLVSCRPVPSVVTQLVIEVNEIFCSLETVVRGATSVFCGRLANTEAPREEEVTDSKFQREERLEKGVAVKGVGEELRGGKSEETRADSGQGGGWGGWAGGRR